MSSELRTPGEKWDLDRVEAMGTAFEGGRGGLWLRAEGGPLDGYDLRVPHIEWARWVVEEPDGELADFVHPPGYIYEPSPEHVIARVLGYYAFDRDSESLIWRATYESAS